MTDVSMLHTRKSRNHVSSHQSNQGDWQKAGLCAWGAASCARKTRTTQDTSRTILDVHSSMKYTTNILYRLLRMLDRLNKSNYVQFPSRNVSRTWQMVGQSWEHSELWGHRRDWLKQCVWDLNCHCPQSPTTPNGGNSKIDRRLFNQGMHIVGMVPKFMLHLSKGWCIMAMIYLTCI